MRKTGLCVALCAVLASPCFAQDIVGSAGNEIAKAASQAAKKAADHAAASAGINSKSADKKQSSMQAQNSGGKPAYSAQENKAASDGAAEPGDAEQAPAPSPATRE
jgi:hypothetical protein